MLRRISPSLLDSFQYFLSIEDEEKSAIARKELIDGFRGIKTSSPSMDAGIAFENAVVLAIKGKFQTDDEVYNDCVKECAEFCKGAIYQYHVKRELGGFMLHGVIDFLKGNRIIDLKTCRTYELGKYTGRFQHKVYLYCLRHLEIDNFTYLVSDFSDVYREDYVWKQSYADDLREAISNFKSYLENDSEMKQAFEAKDHQKETWKQSEILRG